MITNVGKHAAMLCADMQATSYKQWGALTWSS